MLLAAGFAAHRGLLELRWVVALAFVASTLGDQIYFYLGRRHGPRLLARFPTLQAELERLQPLAPGSRLAVLDAGGAVVAQVRGLSGSTEAPGGWRALAGYLTASLLVAWAGALYLADEGYTSSRSGFFLIVLCFVAKDLLVAVAGIAQQFRVDPWSVIARIRQALRGGPPP